jgi:hypothetical protein
VNGKERERERDRAGARHNRRERALHWLKSCRQYTVDSVKAEHSGQARQVELLWRSVCVEANEGRKAQAPAKAEGSTSHSFFSSFDLLARWTTERKETKEKKRKAANPKKKEKEKEKESKNKADGSATHGRRGRGRTEREKAQTRER